MDYYNVNTPVNLIIPDWVLRLGRGALTLRMKVLDKPKVLRYDPGK
jgi:hypothetical protein